MSVVTSDIEWLQKFLQNDCQRWILRAIARFEKPRVPRIVQYVEIMTLYKSGQITDELVWLVSLSLPSGKRLVQLVPSETGGFWLETPGCVHRWLKGDQ